jgi:hypothetical protein
VNKTRTLILSLVLFLITVPSTVFADGGYSDNSDFGIPELIILILLVLFGIVACAAIVGKKHP